VFVVPPHQNRRSREFEAKAWVLAGFELPLGSFLNLSFLMDQGKQTVVKFHSHLLAWLLPCLWLLPGLSEFAVREDQNSPGVRLSFGFKHVMSCPIHPTATATA